MRDRTSGNRDHWIRLLTVSGVFGLAGLLVMWANFYVLIPGLNVPTDAREVFVLLGAAVTGPVGGLVSGFLSALADPSDMRWYSATIHSLAAMLVGWASARFVSTRPRNGARLLSWVAIVVTYYVFPFFVLICYYLVAPEACMKLLPAGVILMDTVEKLIRGWATEFILTLIVTSTALMILPERILTLVNVERIPRLPLPKAPATEKERFNSRAWPGGISIRLMLWFLLLSILPLFVVSVFVQDNVAQSFLLAESGKQRETARLLAREISTHGIASAFPEMRALKRGATQFYFIIDQSGKYVVHLDSSKVGKSMSDDFSESTVASVLKGPSGIAADRTGEHSIGYAPVVGSELRAVSVQGKDAIAHALSDLQNTINIKLGSTLLIISLVWGAVIWLIVGRPMKKMTRAAQEVARGNLQIALDPRDMEAEIAVLAQTFNEMTESLSLIHRDMESEIAQRKATEETLREREKQFRLLAENSTDMISRHDLQGRYLYVSPACRFVLGYEPEELVGRSAFDFVHPNDLELLTQHHKRQVEQYIMNPIVFRALRKDKTSVWFESTSRIVSDMNTGGPAEIHVSSRDISQRMVTELALKESEERLRLVVSNVPVVLYSINKDEVFTLSEGKGLDALGLKPGQVVGKSMTSVYGDFPDIIEGNRRALAGEPSQKTAVVGPLVFDAWYTPIRDSSEKVIGVIGVAIDVTDRKRAEDAVRESERMHKTLIEQSADPIYVIQFNRLVFVNRAWEESFGYSSAEATSDGFNLLSIVGPESRAIVAERLNRYASGAQAASRYEMKGMRRDGSALDLDVSVAIIDWKGKPAIQGIYRDITERKKAEEAVRHSQKAESLGILAGGIAHDFNNLLQAMLGQTSLALTRIPQDNPAYSNVAKAEKAAQRAAELTRQLLAYSGRGKFDVRPIDLNALIHENLRFLELAIPKGVTLEENLAADLPLIDADAGQIQQVVMNLIINASEAIGDRDGRIHLRTSTEMILPEHLDQWTRATDSLAPGNVVQLEISDSGVGMTPDTLKKIFDPFFTTKVTGRGLGLSAVIGIVKGHQGGLRVDSDPGRRTTFKIAFPASRISRTQGAVAPTPNQPGQYEGCILVVDDEPDVREVLTDMLEELGVKTYIAETGEKGIELYKSKWSGIDLVLLDLSMPGMGGKETFRRMKAINANAKVVMTSGYSESEVTDDLKTLGLTGFIQKPYRYDILKETIVNFMVRTSAS